MPFDPKNWSGITPLPRTDEVYAKPNGRPQTQPMDVMPILKGLNSFMPFTGDAQAVYDAYHDFKNKDYVSGGLNSLGVLPFMPALGGIFVGAKGAKNNLSIQISQDLAKQLRDKGLDDREIWRQTRVATGYPTSTAFPDGHIQTEISDANAMFSIPDHLKREDIPKGSHAGRTSSFMPHTGLSRTYPELMGQKTYISKPGVLEPDTRAVRFSTANLLNGDYYLDPSKYDEAKGSLLHELSHGIDDFEGMSNGANPETLKKRLDEIKIPAQNYYELLAIERLAKKYGVSVENALNMQFSKTKHPTADIYLNEGYRKYELDNLVRSGKKSVEERLRDNIEPAVRSVGGWHPGRAYKNTMGEVKARLVDARRNLTMPERAHSYPLDYESDSPYVMDTLPDIQLFRDPSGNVVNKDTICSVSMPESEFIKRQDEYIHREDLDLHDSKNKWADGGYVDKMVDDLSKEDLEELMLQIETDDPQCFAEGGLVLDPAQGLLSNGMDLVNPTNNVKAPFDIPLNSNNMLAKYRAGTPQAQHYTTR
jgi:hypothetical protein